MSALGSLSPYHQLIRLQCQLTGMISGDKFRPVNSERNETQREYELLWIRLATCDLSSWREQLKGRFHAASDLITELVSTSPARERVSSVRGNLHGSWVVRSCWQVTTCHVLSVSSRVLQRKPGIVKYGKQMQFCILQSETSQSDKKYRISHR